MPRAVWSLAQGGCTLHGTNCHDQAKDIDRFLLAQQLTEKLALAVAHLHASGAALDRAATFLAEIFANI